MCVDEKFFRILILCTLLCVVSLAPADYVSVNGTKRKHLYFVPSFLIHINFNFFIFLKMCEHLAFYVLE